METWRQRDRMEQQQRQRQRHPPLPPRRDEPRVAVEAASANESPISAALAAVLAALATVRIAGGTAEVAAVRGIESAIEALRLDLDRKSARTRHSAAASFLPPTSQRPLSLPRTRPPRPCLSFLFCPHCFASIVSCVPSFNVFIQARTHLQPLFCSRSIDVDARLSKSQRPQLKFVVCSAMIMTDQRTPLSVRVVHDCDHRR